MQSLSKLKLIIELWWKKVNKLSFLYLFLFLGLYFSATCQWVTGKPSSIAAEVIKRITSYDFTRSYSGFDLMESYFWLLLLPFTFSLALFNKISVFLLNLIIMSILLLKIYDTYIDLNANIPFREQLAPYITVDYHTEMYLFFILSACMLIFSLVHIFLPKKI